jgi:hypothetical protein
MELPHERHPVPPVHPARFERPFFSLAMFAGVTVFFCGAYLLKDALRNPLGANEMSVVVGGFMLALATFLVVYAIWPRLKAAFGGGEESRRQEDHRSSPTLTTYGETAQNRLEAEQALEEQKDLPGPM